MDDPEEDNINLGKRKKSGHDHDHYLNYDLNTLIEKDKDNKR